MLKIKLSDLEKASIVFNHLLKSGDMSFYINRMAKLDDRYTAYCNRGLLSDYSRSHGNSFHPVVSTYRPWNVFTSAYARTYTGDFTKIQLNSRKLNRKANQLDNISSIIGSIAHEWGHCFEFYLRTIYPTIKFNHGANRVDEKARLFSFQYQLGRIAKTNVRKDLERLLSDLGIK